MARKRRCPTIPSLEAVHRRAVAGAVSRALQESDWSILPASRVLGITHQRLRRILDRHPELAARQRAEGPGVGRPAAPGE